MTTYEYSGGCNCLPACTVVQYDVEVSPSNYEWKEMYRALQIPVFNTEESVFH